MIITPLVRKGAGIIPASVGDIFNNCAGNIQLSGTDSLLLGTTIAAGDVLLEDPVAASKIVLFPKAIDLLNALRGNANPEQTHSSPNYALPAIIKYEMEQQVNQVQSGMTFTRIFYGDPALAEETFIYLEKNEGIFFDDQNLDVFTVDLEIESGEAISFAANEWKLLQFKILNSNEPTIVNGSTLAGTPANAVQIDLSLVRYLAPGMSLYTADATIFDSEEGEVKVLTIDYDRGILFLSEDRVAPSASFHLRLTPTIIITPIMYSSGGGGGTGTVAWGDIEGDITDQTDLDTLLGGIAADITAAEAELVSLDSRLDTAEADIIALQTSGIVTLRAFSTLPAANFVDILSIPATFSAIWIYVLSASCDTASRYLQGLVSYDNGSTFPTAQWYGGRVQNGTGIAVAGTDSFVVVPVNTAAQGTNYNILLYGVSNALLPLQAISTGTYAGGTPFSMNAGTLVATAAVNAIRLRWDSTGIFDGGGSCAVYGIP